jgi:hypothetical protein
MNGTAAGQSRPVHSLAAVTREARTWSRGSETAAAYRRTRVYAERVAAEATTELLRFARNFYVRVRPIAVCC